MQVGAGGGQAGPLEMPASAWFEYLLGVPEAQWLAAREASLVPAPSPAGVPPRFGQYFSLRNLAHPERAALCAGAFSVWTLAELQALAAAAPAGAAAAPPPVFEIHARTHEACLAQVEASALQVAAAPNTMFQVASNFNACEVPAAHLPVDSGTFVTCLMEDHTQGPACASGAATAAVTRTHAAFYAPGMPPSAWGQGAQRQVELLGHPALRPHFPVHNGKLYAYDGGGGGGGGGAPPWDADAPPASHPLLPRVALGLHIDCPALFVRPPGLARGKACALHRDPASAPRIDQALVAAMDTGAPGARALSPRERDSKMALLLHAAYQLTYAAAAARGSAVLVLTLVGGGVFRNPLPAIAQAIAAAHAAWAHRMPRLRRVELPLFPVGADAGALAAGLRAGGLAGVRVVRHGLDAAGARTRQESED